MILNVHAKQHQMKQMRLWIAFILIISISKGSITLRLTKREFIFFLFFKNKTNEKPQITNFTQKDTTKKNFLLLKKIIIFFQNNKHQQIIMEIIMAAFGTA